MVRQEGVPFIFSRWFIIVVSGITLLFSGFRLIYFPLMGEDLKDKDGYGVDFTTALVIVIIENVWGLCMGALGLYGAIWLKRVPLLIYATIHSIIFVPVLIVLLVIVVMVPNLIPIVQIVIAVLLPVRVICSWILVKGLRQPSVGQNQQKAGPPPDSQPQDGEPPVGQPPVGQPPVGQPPVGQPPVGQPPVGQPPVGQPPVGQPPVGQPSVGQPSVGEPPVVNS